MPLWNIINPDKIINHNDVIKQFKSNLSSYISSGLDEMWEYNDVENRLNILDILKQHFDKSGEPKWRPSNKPVEEHVRPFLIRQQEAKTVFLRKCIAEERQEIVKMESVIEEQRGLIRELFEEQTALKSKLIVRSDNLLKSLENDRNLTINSIEASCTRDNFSTQNQ